MPITPQLLNSALSFDAYLQLTRDIVEERIPRAGLYQADNTFRYTRSNLERMQKVLDQTVLSVVYANNSPEYGAYVTVANLDQMAMPLVLQYETESGKKERMKFPVEIWNNTASFKIKLPTTEKITKLVIDPDKSFPDMNYINNIWIAK